MNDPHVGGWLPFARRACDTASQMEMIQTLSLAGVLLALAVLSGWLGSRPPNPHRGPRLAPWRFIMLLCAASLTFVLGHVVRLLMG
ncbi:MAG TPA: hypothetical protein VHW05_03080 [Phenylobacterium sp.]|jgi:hypothetical protein|nr:hypothetical protein [Phenylobacterium sp.]